MSAVDRCPDPVYPERCGVRFSSSSSQLECMYERESNKRKKFEIFIKILCLTSVQMMIQGTGI